MVLNNHFNGFISIIIPEKENLFLIISLMEYIYQLVNMILQKTNYFKEKG